MTARRFALVVALGVLGLALATAGCSGSGDQGDSESSSPKGQAVAESAAAEPASAEAPATDDVAEAERTAAGAVAVSSGASALPVTGPRIIKTAFLALAVPEGRFEEVVSRARTVASGFGGFVTSSTTSHVEESELVRGTLVVRVPERSYDDAMARIASLGTVEAREESGQDVSAEFVDLESRARHLEAVEAQLLTFLEKAENVAEALTVQSELNRVQLELEQVRGRIRHLDDQTSFATISMDIHEKPPVAATGNGDDGWGVLEAWGDGARGFVGVASATFVGLATAAPIILLVGLVAAIGARGVVSYRRRTRSGGVPTASNPS